MASKKRKSEEFWTTETLEKLRLCRNRAYYKVNQKRRQHLHVSLATYFQKEWQTHYPDSKLTGKELLQVFYEHFDGKEPKIEKKKPRLVDPDMPSKRKHFDNHDFSPPVKIYDDHSDKNWSDLMLTNLLQCAHMATERQRAGENSDFSTILYDEWKKIYPCSTLTARNIKSRFTVYQKTKSEIPPTPKKRKAADINYSPFKPTSSGKSENHFGNSSDESQDDIEEDPKDNMVCPKHFIHLFHDKDESVECFLTQQLLEIRMSLESQFPGCDIYKPKKPKGFAAAVLQEWKRFYPDSEETNKTISFKLAKFDRIPEEDNFGVRVTPKGRTVWSQVMLKHLVEARKIAMDQAMRLGSLQMLGRLWRAEWQKLYPDLAYDWKSVVSRYNYHYGNIDSLNPEFDEHFEAIPGDQRNGGFTKTTNSLTDDESSENIKGFRKWTPKMGIDLMETKTKLEHEHPKVEPGSSEFNKLLLREFQKLYPKCMESSRSLYSKLQSVEKDDLVKFNRSNSTDEPIKFEIKTEPEDNDDDDSYSESDPPDNVRRGDLKTVIRLIRPKICKTDELSKKSRTENVTQQQQQMQIKLEPESRPQSITPSLPDEKTKFEVKNDVHQDPKIEGFEGWTIHMIRDFVACMDVTRKKFSKLKDKEPNGAHIKLVPLLLEGWQELYPGTTETVKTFQMRIKYLSQQKELIKKHLSMLRSKPVENIPEEPFRWSKNMINDVINSRKRALEIKEAGQKEGKKLSFHNVWAAEFKKLHPNSTFSANNLSVHFWTWKREIQKLNKEKSLESPPPSPTQPVNPVPLAHVWNRSEKSHLFEVGRKVEAMFRDPGTPNEVKLEGFANVLFSEWKRANPEREMDPKTETPRCLNMLYSKVAREGPGPEDDTEEKNLIANWGYEAKLHLLQIGKNVKAKILNSTLPQESKPKKFCEILFEHWAKDRHPESPEAVSAKSLVQLYYRLKRDGIDNESSSDPNRILASWTPKHNRVLHECMVNFSGLAVSSGLASYQEQVIQSWRSKFPRSSVKDETLWKKVLELSQSDDSQSGKRQYTKALKSDPNDECDETKGIFVWNATTMAHLVEAHMMALNEMKHNDSNVQLSSLLQSIFTSLHPNCKLSPSVLMAKLFLIKTAQRKGALKLNVNSELPTVSIKTETPSVAKAGGECKQFKSKNLVFRTWTQSMIDDMMSTRKVAIVKKKKRLEENPNDTLPMAEIWYEEFIKLQPEYKSTKKNLWRKYKWYKSRMGQGNDKKLKSEPSDLPSDQSDMKPVFPNKIETTTDADAPKEEGASNSNLIRVKSIRRDVFSYIKTVLEEPRIFLPAKLADIGDPIVTPPPLKTFIKPISSLRVGPVNQAMGPIQNGPFVLPTPSTVVPTTVSVMPIINNQGQMMRPGITFLSSGQTQLIPAQGQFFQQQMVCPNGQIMPLFSKTVTQMPSWQSLPQRQVTVMPVAQFHASQQQQQQFKQGTNQMTSSSNDSIKLPGGATLVAVTDRNADQLLKPKHLEKPHVTITIGERQELSGNALKLEHQPNNNLVMPQHNPQPATLTAIMHTPTQQIPLTIPTYQPRPSVVQPPPLTHLRPQAPMYDISARVRVKLDELGIKESSFGDLLKLYTSTREDYIATLKKGYLAFFPFLLGAAWREKFPVGTNLVTGRKLASLMDSYSEDKRKGKMLSPEYLTKVPSQFVVTELMLKQLMVCHEDTKELVERQINFRLPPAAIYFEMCRRWPKVHPEIRLTTKQLISVHHMLSYEPEKDATPEIECQLTEIWKIMEKEVSITSVLDSTKSPEDEESNLSSVEEIVSYDDANLSMEQLQEWFLATMNIPRFRKQKSRPKSRLVVAQWNPELNKDLLFLSAIASRRSLDCRWRHRRLSQADLLHRTWKSCHPTSTVSKQHLLARCAWLIRLEKRKQARLENKVIDEWRSACEEFCRNEEKIEVINEIEEERKRRKKLDRIEHSRMLDHDLTPGFSGRLTSLTKHALLNLDDWKRDFTKDENVLAYIGAMQKSAKGNHPITWTPDVIADLMKARTEARRRKRSWEEWAVKKFGGVGIAYNTPNVKFTKVDEMFREEWSKLRPELSSLSIWTLVSYARKFDNLKKQLIEATGGLVTPEKDGKSHDLDPSLRPMLNKAYFHDSSIPKYDLENLVKMRDIPKDLKDLITTRQQAKEKQIDPTSESSLYTLNHLWEEAWKAMYPRAKVTGSLLQKRLYIYEQNIKFRSRLYGAMIDEDLLEDPRLGLPAERPDEVLPIKPRDVIFPENEEDDEESNLFCYQNKFEPRPTISKTYLNLSRDILKPRHPTFEIPIVEAQRLEAISETTKIKSEAKGYNLQEKMPASRTTIAFKSIEGKYWCTHCDTTYSNVNNYVYHLRLHQLPDILSKL